MRSSLLSLRSRFGVAIIALVLASGAWAQAPEQEPSRPNQPKLREPTAQSVQPRGDLPTSDDGSQAAADIKLREIDRRLKRTMRSVCIGC